MPYRIHYLKTNNENIKNIFKKYIIKKDINDNEEILNIDTSKNNSYNNDLLNNLIDYKKEKDDKQKFVDKYPAFSL